MESIWTKINDSIQEYFTNLRKYYLVKFVKVSEISTAIIFDKFALIIKLDRFDADVSYIFRNENDRLTSLRCGNFFAALYDEGDRSNLLVGEGAKIYVVNSLKIIDRGLTSKWCNVLNGDIQWINDFKNSEWYEEEYLKFEEVEILKKYI